MPRIGDQQRLAFLQHPLAGGRGARLLDALEAEPRLEPEAVEVHPADVGVVGAAQHRGQLRQLIESGIGIAVEDVEFRMQKRLLILKEL